MNGADAGNLKEKGEMPPWKEHFEKLKKLVDELKEGISDPRELLPEIKLSLAKAKLPKDTEKSLGEEIKTNTVIGYIKIIERNLKTTEEEGGFKDFGPKIKEYLAAIKDTKAKLSDKDTKLLIRLNKEYDEQNKMHESLEQFHKGSNGNPSHNYTPSVPKAETNRQR